MFFRKRKLTGTPTGVRGESRVAEPFRAVELVSQEICGSTWNGGHSLSHILGMAMGGMRTSALFTNDRLNEQANALTNLTQKPVPLVIHVQDFSTGNNQSLRLPIFRFFAGSSQQSADFTLIAHKLSEAALIPVMVIHAGSATPYEHPAAGLLQNFLGTPSDLIPTPTPAQVTLFGKKRRRIPELWNVELPMTIGLTMPAVLRDRHWAARQAFFLNHVDGLLQKILKDFVSLTGRSYAPAEWMNPDAKHQVVTTEPILANLPDSTPLVKIHFLTPELHQKLSAKTLTFIDRNHARALGTALNLQGFSLVHYGSINAKAVEQALALSPEQPVGIVGARFTFAPPCNPKEEIYNQQLQDLYHVAPIVEALGPVRRPVEPPSALQRHPVHPAPLADLHRFWSHNGKFLASGQTDQVVATPMLATGVLPAASGKMLPPVSEQHAQRVVLAGDFVATLVTCLQRENFATEHLEAVARSWASTLQRMLEPGADLPTLLQASMELVAEQYTGGRAALLSEWKNARHLLPEDTALTEQFTSQGGILVADSSPQHSVFFDALPNSADRFLADPANILLDKDAFESYVRTEDTAQQTISHLISAVARIESRRKTATLRDRAEDLLAKLKLRIGQKLSVSLSGELGRVLAKLGDQDLTLAELAQQLDRQQAPVDKLWLAHVHTLQQDLEALVATPERASHGIVSQNASGVYPWSPVVVPWAQNGNGEGISLSLGIWEAHMAQICPDFVTLRKAELEVQNRYNPRIHDSYFAEFTWKQLNQEELGLCPPLVVTGTDADFYQKAGNLGELFRSGAPIKVLVFDTLQSHPASLLQQLLAHDIYVLQATLADRTHLLQGMMRGFNFPHAAVLQVLSPARSDYLAFTERAVSLGLYPVFQGTSGDFAETIELHPQTHTEPGFRDGATFADLVLGDPGFADGFMPFSGSAGISVCEYLELDAEDRAEAVPVVQGQSPQGASTRWKVSATLLDRVDEWQRTKALLRQLKRLDHVGPTPEEMFASAQAHVVDTVTQSLLRLAQD